MEIFQLMVFVIPVFSPGLKLFAFFFFPRLLSVFSLPPSLPRAWEDYVYE